MPELPERKVGIVACSGEELAEGTVTRLAALKVLEQLRPAETVTICLPLFLAGGEGDRAFASFYPDHRGRRLRQALRGARHRAVLGQAGRERRRERPGARAWPGPARRARAA